MNLKEITLNRQYINVLREIESLMNAQTGTLEGATLDGLVSMVEDFERKRLTSCFQSVQTI